MKKILSAGLLAFMVLIGATTAVAQSDNQKVTICHAAGLAGTDKYVTLTLSENAVYGPAGHFNENGTPQAGHEEDYLGPCLTPTPSTSPTIVPSASPTVSNSPEPSVSPSISPSSEPSNSPTTTPSESPNPIPSVDTGGGPDITPPPTDTDGAVSFLATAAGLYLIFGIITGIIGFVVLLFVLRSWRN